MILFPAIDLKGGQCVRLRQGDMAQATIFNPDPADQAARFAAAGARYLHIVDLDGAFAGRSANDRAVEAILAATGLPCQLGGGIRDLAAIEHWLGRGVARVILGTIALKAPDLVRAAARLFPGRIAIGIDARDGRVAVSGWAETATLTAIELAHRFADAGIAVLIHTDIERDGMGRGLNIAASAALAAATAIPVIASGGVADLTDIDRLIAAAPLAAAKGGGFMGAIAGRALYEGHLDLAAAQDRLDRARPC